MNDVSRGVLVNMPEPGVIEYLDFPLPELEASAVLLDVIQTNVCGSELHIFHGKHPVKKSGGLGHELVGRVAQIGQDRTTDSRGQALHVGDRVVVTYFQTCQRCTQCARGAYNLCDNAYEFFSKQPTEWPHFHAGFASHYYVHPQQHLYRVPDQLADAVVASANCALSQVLYGVDQIGVNDGDIVLIQGAGGLGLCAIAIARQRGARTIVIDAVESRLEQARAFGADLTIDLTVVTDPAERLRLVQEFTDGHGADVGIEVAGVPAAFQEGIDLVRRGGRYLVMGNVSPGQSVDVDPGKMTRKALTLRHIDRYEARYLSNALQFLVDHGDEYPFGGLIDAVFDFDDVQTALERSLAREVTRASIRVEGTVNV